MQRLFRSGGAGEHAGGIPRTRQHLAYLRHLAPRGGESPRALLLAGGEVQSARQNRLATRCEPVAAHGGGQRVLARQQAHLVQLIEKAPFAIPQRCEGDAIKLGIRNDEQTLTPPSAPDSLPNRAAYISFAVSVPS